MGTKPRAIARVVPNDRSGLIVVFGDAEHRLVASSALLARMNWPPRAYAGRLKTMTYTGSSVA
jgi:hypothetical protein